MVMIEILSALTLIGDIILLLLVPAWLLRKQLKPLRQKIAPLVPKLSFIIALIAVSGSLYFSEILAWNPCKLCWLQRIMMYPLLLIFLIAVIAKARDYRKYVLPLAVLGVPLSIYHYWTQRFGAPPVCSAAAESCASYPFLYFGYITIPIMALTAFLLIIVLNNLFWKE